MARMIAVVMIKMIDGLSLDSSLNDVGGSGSGSGRHDMLSGCSTRR